MRERLREYRAPNIIIYFRFTEQRGVRIIGIQMDSINMMRAWGEERYKEINNRMKEFIELDGET